MANVHCRHVFFGSLMNRSRAVAPSVKQMAPLIDSLSRTQSGGTVKDESKAETDKVYAVDQGQLAGWHDSHPAKLITVAQAKRLFGEDVVNADLAENLKYREALMASVVDGPVKNPTAIAVIEEMYYVEGSDGKKELYKPMDEDYVSIHGNTRVRSLPHAALIAATYGQPFSYTVPFVTGTYANAADVWRQQIGDNTAAGVQIRYSFIDYVLICLDAISKGMTLGATRALAGTAGTYMSQGWAVAQLATMCGFDIISAMKDSKEEVRIFDAMLKTHDGFPVCPEDMRRMTFESALNDLISKAKDGKIGRKNVASWYELYQKGEVQFHSPSEVLLWFQTLRGKKSPTTSGPGEMTGGKIAAQMKTVTESSPSKTIRDMGKEFASADATDGPVIGRPTIGIIQTNSAVFDRLVEVLKASDESTRISVSQGVLSILNVPADNVISVSLLVSELSPQLVGVPHEKQQLFMRLVPTLLGATDEQLTKLVAKANDGKFLPK